MKEVSGLRRGKVVHKTSLGLTEEGLQNLNWIRDYYKEKEGFTIEDVLIQIYERALKELRKKLESRKN